MAPKRRQTKKAAEKEDAGASPAAAEPSAQPAEHEQQNDEKAAEENAVNGSDAPVGDEKKPARSRRASSKTGPAPAKPEGVTKRSTRTRAVKQVGLFACSHLPTLLPRPQCCADYVARCATHVLHLTARSACLAPLHV